jgi:hypothetical protein
MKTILWRDAGPSCQAIARLLFRDEDTVRHYERVFSNVVMPAYGWLPKGERAEIPSNTGRERVNLNGALNAQTHEVFIEEGESVNA